MITVPPLASKDQYIQNVAIGQLATKATSASSSITGLSSSIKNLPVNPIQYGAIADGNSHPLSGLYSSVAAAQAAFPLIPAQSIFSTTQEIDWAASQESAYVAFGAPGSEHGTAAGHLNRPLYFPQGIYNFGNDTLSIRNLAGGVFYGDGQFTTILESYSTNAVVSFDGVWYVDFRDFGISQLSTSATCGFSIDGQSTGIPGHTYNTIGVQGLNFQNCSFQASGGPYCFVNGYFSGGTQQGSEIQFSNCHLLGAGTACYAQYGFNALDNIFFGGDCQNFHTHAIYTNNSPLSVYGMSFESGWGYTQYLNGGYDIYSNNSGVNSGGIIAGCRSESFRFFFNGGSNLYSISACNGDQNVSSQDNSLTFWSSGTVYGGTGNPQAVLVIGNTFVGPHRSQVWTTTSSGVSGSTQPTWTATPTSTSTLTDGTVTWNFLNYDFIQNNFGSIDYDSCQFEFNAGNARAVSFRGRSVSVSAGYTVGNQFPFREDYIQVSSTGGPLTITLDDNWISYPYPLTVQKTDGSTNAISVVVNKLGWGLNPSQAGSITNQYASYTYMVGGGNNNVTVIAKSSGA